MREGKFREELLARGLRAVGFVGANGLEDLVRDSQSFSESMRLHDRLRLQHITLSRVNFHPTLFARACGR